jgi:hypothetical protein
MATDKDTSPELHDALICLKQGEDGNVAIECKFDKSAALDNGTPDFTNKAVFMTDWILRNGQMLTTLAMVEYKLHQELGAARHNLQMLALRDEQPKLNLVAPDGARLN